MFCKFIEDDLAAWKTICSKVCVSDQPLFQRYSVVLCLLGWPLGCRYDITVVVVGPHGWRCFSTKTGGKIVEPRVVLQKAICSSRSWRQSNARSTLCLWWARHLHVFFSLLQYLRMVFFSLIGKDFVLGVGIYGTADSISFEQKGSKENDLMALPWSSQNLWDLSSGDGSTRIKMLRILGMKSSTFTDL